MGKIQRKADPHHRLTTSTNLTAFIEKAASLPLVELPAHLATLSRRWPFPRGDLYHWVEVLDRFDDVLQKFNKLYGLSEGPQTKCIGTLVLEGEEGFSPENIAKHGLGGDGDRLLVQSILSCSRVLLEKCGNRALYNSTDRLNDLLNTTSLPLLYETLLITLALARKFAERSQQPIAHAHFHQFDVSKLVKITSSVQRTSTRRNPLSPVKTPKARDNPASPKLRRAPTTADPNDFQALARPDNLDEGAAFSERKSSEQSDWFAVAHLKVTWTVSEDVRPGPIRSVTSTDIASSPTPIRRHTGFDLTTPGSRTGVPKATEQSAHSNVRSLEFSASDLQATTIEHILESAPKSMPQATRYELLHKLRTAYALIGSQVTRWWILVNKLAALGILAQVLSEDEITLKVFGDGDGNYAASRQRLVQNLIALLRQAKSDSPESLTLQSLAIESLIALSRYRQMHVEINTAMAGNSSHGLMLSKVQRALVDIAQDHDATDNDIGDEWRHSIFTLWMIVTNYAGQSGARSVEQHIHKSLLAAYTSTLKYTTAKALRIHTYVIQFFSYLLPYRDGLQLLNANGCFAAVCDATDKIVNQALTQYQKGQGLPAEARTPGTDYEIPYQEQYALRELNLLVKEVYKCQGNHADRALRTFVDSSALLQAYRIVLSNMTAFGAHTWSSVVEVVCGFLNNEPTSYTVVSDAGIVLTLLTVIDSKPDVSETGTATNAMTRSDKPGAHTLVLPAKEEVINNLACAFGAICLTEAGLNTFMETNALTRFLEIFESPEHVTEMKDSNSPVQLGSTFDELVRHHPKLKNAILSAIITTVARVRYLCKSRMKTYGAGPKIWEEGSEPLKIAGEAADLTADFYPPQSNREPSLMPIQLPDGSTLTFETEAVQPSNDLTTSASDEDDMDTSALDYARALISFLSSFVDNAANCKELFAPQVIDLVLDFASLSTLPVTFESFSEGQFMQDLISIICVMSNDRPALVVPQLLEEARYLCKTALADFIDFKPTQLESYFHSNIPHSSDSTAKDLEQLDNSRASHQTRTVRALMMLQCIVRCVADQLFVQASRLPHTSVVCQLNITDIFAEVIELLGRLSAACIRENVTILSELSEEWTSCTRPPGQTTGDSQLDTILRVSEKQNDAFRKDEKFYASKQATAGFRNLTTLRNLFGEVSGAISALYSKLGSSFTGKSRKLEHFARQKMVDVSNAMARGTLAQIDPPFLSTAFECNDKVLGKDAKFKYLCIVMCQFRTSLYEDTNNSSIAVVRQPFTLNAFWKYGGIEQLAKIGTNFYEELRSCQDDHPVSSTLSANAGLKICLELFAELTNADLIASQHSTYLKSTSDHLKDYWFNPNQLLMEIRMIALRMCRKIWESEYAEQASLDIIRSLTRTLSNIFTAEQEDSVIANDNERPKLRGAAIKQFEIDAEHVATLETAGVDKLLAEEAIFRCNITGQNSSTEHAQRYCDALRANPFRRRLPIPAGAAKAKSTDSEATTGDDAMAMSVDISEADASSSANLPIRVEPMPTWDFITKELIEAERESMRENLADRCTNILSTHSKTVFEIHDLLLAAAPKSGDGVQQWCQATSELLVQSLLSQEVDGQVDEPQAKRVEAPAHLIGLLCGNDLFKSSLLKILQEYFDQVTEFLQFPSQQACPENLAIWVPAVLLILENLLAQDAEPANVEFETPKDLDHYEPPQLKHSAVVQQSSKNKLFDQLMTVLPQVKKDSSAALSILRVLVILTRDAGIAARQSERKNLQRLFLMAKQLGANSDARIQGAFFIILRNVIEDKDVIKQIMISEIKFWFKSRTHQRNVDLTHFIRELPHLVLRSPELFVEASNETIKLVSWNSNGPPLGNAPLALKEDPIKEQSKKSSSQVDEAKAQQSAPTQSIELDTVLPIVDANSTEHKMPVIERPDGVIHFLLSELLSYKEVEDQEIPNEEKSDPASTSTTGESSMNAEIIASGEDSKEKSEKPRFKAESHPIFIYRCFLLHCLTELLHSYNKTKVEFLSFSRKADPLAATPSKAKPGILNYILTSLVSSGYVEKEDSIICRKRLATSDWAVEAIVALCSKTGETGLGNGTESRYPSTLRYIDDDGSEQDLAYIRRFVLDQAIRNFKDAIASPEPVGTRYARLLCLAKLFHKLISKQTGAEGTAHTGNSSYRRISRIMLEKNFIAILTSAMSDVDLSFPGAKKVVKFILRPLKDLTAVATHLSNHSPDEFPVIVDQVPDEPESSTSSDVSDLDDDDREETPDLYRNSALGMLDRRAHDDSDTDEDDDEDEDIEYDGYDDEMEYDEEMPAINDGEVVSDEELEVDIDGAGPLEGLPGDIPMEIDFVVGHHHHHHHHGDEDDDSEPTDDDDDDDSDDESDDGEDIEIEVEEDEEGDEDPTSDAHSHDDDEEAWEDEEEDEEDVEDAEDDVVDDLVVGGSNVNIGQDDRGPNMHLNTLLRVLGENTGDLLPGAHDIDDDGNNIFFGEDDEDVDADEDGQDMVDVDGGDYDDQPFDVMLQDDFDENDDWGWDEPPQPIFRRHRRPRSHTHQPFISRRIMTTNHTQDMMHMMGSGRHYRRAPQPGRPAEDGQNPLLQRPEPAAREPPRHRIVESIVNRSMPIVFSEGGGLSVPFAIDGSGLAGITGHGNILDAIMGAIQRGSPRIMQDGRLQLSFTTDHAGAGMHGFFPNVETATNPRQIREDPYKSTMFTPMSTVNRWQEQVRMVFLKDALQRTQNVQKWVYAVLIPALQIETKNKEAEKAKLKAEREAEEEQLKQQREAEAARLAIEKAKEEEEERLAEAKAAEERAANASQHQASQDAMEDVQRTVADTPANPEAPVDPDRPRIFTTLRSGPVDITDLGIDAEYLEALPEELREEVIMSHFASRPEGTNEEESALDEDFLNALPEDMREELRGMEAARRRRQERSQRQAESAAGQARDMDADDFLATLDPALRRVILAEQSPEILSSLSPQHAEEGRATRNMFFQPSRLSQRDPDGAQDRGSAWRDNNKRTQLVQLIDKAGVATLLRLMFLQQQGTMRNYLLQILSQVCANRQTRTEVVSLILVILKEGSADSTAIERSFASLSLRATSSPSQKTPQPLKRPNTMQHYAGLADDVTPTLVVQQCLATLKHICDQNPSVKSLFLREVDVTTSSRSKAKPKGKLKEAKTTTHPINDLISLLDRRVITDSAGCLHSLASLLSTVTSPIASLMRWSAHDGLDPKENKEMPEEDEKISKSGNDVTMQDSSPEVLSGIAESSQRDAKAEEQKPDEATEKAKKKHFEPPTITDHNLKLITNIFVAPECDASTFTRTLDTLKSLAHIPGTTQQFSKELMRHVHALSQSICADLDDLLPAIEDAQSSTDVQGVAAAKFSATASDQVKLLRVLQALDHLTEPKKDSESTETPSKSVLTLSYEALGLAPLWTRLSSCLSAVEEKGDTISFANILLPMIESLMVVCKNTKLKDAPIQVKDGGMTSPSPNADENDLDDLFFRFTSDHRKILNDIIRQNPKLMQGQFAILVKNSKVLDFDNKRNYFTKQMHSRHEGHRHTQDTLQLNVRRDQVFIDSYKAMYYKSPHEMKYGKLNIRFNGEEGVDAGGVTREWFHILARGMFDPNYALFQPVASDKTTFHPNPLSKINPEHLMYFKFIGRIIGKALYEGRVLDCHFSRALYKRMLGKKPNLKDLESNDVDYYKSLVWILENDITDILTEEFCVIEDEFGEEKVIDLIPNGRDIAVTEENKKDYVQKLVEYRLTESVKEQLDNFLFGFHEIIPAELISIFNEQELELLISGLPEIDVDDWKANTEYHNYNPSSQQVVWFWRIVKAMTNEERAKLLQFITGTSKVPLNGFKELEGVSGLTRCNIHKDPSTNRLPTSHTCFNQLDLPAYDSFEVMKQNLFTAINLGADYFGFA